MGMYELLFVILTIIFATYLWIMLGYNLKSYQDQVSSIMPNDAYSDVSQPLDWSVTGFYVFLFVVSILAIIWAVKK